MLPDSAAALTGVQVSLKAIAFSVEPGGTIEKATFGGSLRTHGDDVVTVEVSEGGMVGSITVGGTIEALGSGSTRTAIAGDAPTLRPAPTTANCPDRSACRRPIATVPQGQLHMATHSISSVTATMASRKAVDLRRWPALPDVTDSWIRPASVQV